MWQRVTDEVAGGLARGQFLRAYKGHSFNTRLYIVDEGTTMREMLKDNDLTSTNTNDS